MKLLFLQLIVALLGVHGRSVVTRSSRGVYRFRYQVDDESTGDVKSQSESRDDDGVVSGSFRFLQPDGCVRVVHYTADSKGFHPTVTYEGPDCHRHLSTAADSSSLPAVVKPVLDALPGQDPSSGPDDHFGLTIPRPSQQAATNLAVQSTKFRPTNVLNANELNTGVSNQVGNQFVSSSPQSVPSTSSKPTETTIIPGANVQSLVQSSTISNFGGKKASGMTNLLAGQTGETLSSQLVLPTNEQNAFGNKITQTPETSFLISKPATASSFPNNNDRIPFDSSKPLNQQISGAFTNGLSEKKSEPAVTSSLLPQTVAVKPSVGEIFSTPAESSSLSTKPNSVTVQSSSIETSKKTVPAAILSLLQSFDDSKSSSNDPILPEASEAVSVSVVPAPEGVIPVESHLSESPSVPVSSANNNEKFLSSTFLTQTLQHLVPSPISSFLENLKQQKEDAQPSHQFLDKEPREHIISETIPVSTAAPVEIATDSTVPEVEETTKPSTESAESNGIDHVSPAATEQFYSEVPHDDIQQQPLMAVMDPVPGTVFISNPVMETSSHPVLLRHPSGGMRAYVPAYQLSNSNLHQPHQLLLPYPGVHFQSYDVRPTVTSATIPAPKPTWSPYFSPYVYQP